MTDIHCHILYGVDDGAKTPEESLAMLEDAADQGITQIIATPHYRLGMFPYYIDDIRESYEFVSAKASELGIYFRLGCEYHADSEMVANIKQRRVATLAGGDHVLTEFSGASTYAQIRSRLGELTAGGYIPVIAHAERIGVFREDTALIDEVRRMGAMIQLNADSILGSDGFGIKRACRKILKEDLADIVASDAHNMSDRCNRMRRCMDYVGSKYGEEMARRLFVINPDMIIRQ